MNGALGGADSLETDPTAGDSRGSSGPDPALLEPLQEMTEGEEPLQVRRDLDSPATEASSSPATVYRGVTGLGSPVVRQAEVSTLNGIYYYRFQLRGDLFFGDIP